MVLSGRTRIINSNVYSVFKCLFNEVEPWVFPLFWDILGYYSS